MATRGCTSRAASREPQVFRVPWTVIRGTPALITAAIEAPAEVAWLDRRAMPGREDQAGLDPGISGALAVGFLLLAELERGDAQIKRGDAHINEGGASDVSVLTWRRRNWRPTAGPVRPHAVRPPAPRESRATGHA